MKNITLLIYFSLFYSLGILWFLLFPSISISTGEYKPRQLFVDEHGLLSHTTPLEKINFLLMDHENDTIPTASICNMLNKINVHECSKFVLDENKYIISALVLPHHRPNVMESFLFVVPTNAAFVSFKLFRLLSSLMLRFSSVTWLSKSVLFLFIPVDSSEEVRYSRYVNQWLENYHSPHLKSSNVLYHGVIRHALVLDSLSSTHRSDFDVPFQLFFSGVNGALPNMDMISTLLAIYPDSTIAGTGGKLERAFVSSQMSSALLQRRGYGSGLANLASFGADGLRCDGWHGQFLQYNIDAVTLRLAGGLMAFDPPPPSGTRQGEGTSGGASHSNATLHQLASLINSAVRICSNLHGTHTSSFLLSIVISFPILTYSFIIYCTTYIYIFHIILIPCCLVLSLGFRQRSCTIPSRCTS